MHNSAPVGLFVDDAVDLVELALDLLALPGDVLSVDSVALIILVWVQDVSLHVSTTFSTSLIRPVLLEDGQTVWKLEVRLLHLKSIDLVLVDAVLA